MKSAQHLDLLSCLSLMRLRLIELRCAGLKTAFITQTEREYLAAYPAPTLIGSSLCDVAHKILSI